MPIEDLRLKLELKRANAEPVSAGPSKKSRKEKKKEGIKCPFPGCTVQTNYIKDHAFKKHLPFIFRLHHLQTASMRTLVVAALRSMALYLLGEGHDFYDLAKDICGDLLATELSLEYADVLLKFCKEQGWSIPREFLTNDSTCPAVLLHWRPLLMMWGGLTDVQRRSFLQTFEVPEFVPKTQPSSSKDQNNNLNPPDAVAEVPPVLQTPSPLPMSIDVVTETAARFPTSSLTRAQSMPALSMDGEPSEEIVGENPILSLDSDMDLEVSHSTASMCEADLLMDEAFDSHFHLDRTRRRLLGKASRALPEDLIDHTMSSKASYVSKLKP